MLLGVGAFWTPGQVNKGKQEFWREFKFQINNKTKIYSFKSIIKWWQAGRQANNSCQWADWLAVKSTVNIGKNRQKKRKKNFNCNCNWKATTTTTITQFDTPKGEKLKNKDCKAFAWKIDSKNTNTERKNLKKKEFFSERHFISFHKKKKKQMSWRSVA